MVCAVFLLDDAYAQHYDFTRGSGAKHHPCLGLRLGPEITPTNLDLAYVKHNSIKIKVRGTNDSILCVGFFSPARRSMALKTNFHFFDGTIWTIDDIDKRTNIRALASPMLPGDPPGNTPAQAPRPGASYTPIPAPAAAPAAAPAGEARGPVQPSKSNRATGQPKKCIVGGQVTYTDGDCPNGGTQKAATPRSADAPQLPPLPELQSGLWKLSVTNNGTTTTTDHCGDPLDFFRKAMSETTKPQESGCKVQGTSPVARQVNYVVICPTDWVSVNGDRFAKEGRSELRVTSPSAQIYTTDWKETIVQNRHQIVQGTRVGNCN